MTRRNPNGMGSTLKLKNGKYKHTISVGVTAEGKIKRVSATADTRIYAIREAEKKAEKYKKERMLIRDEITFGQLAEKSIEKMLKTGKIQESTYLRKLETLKRLKPLKNLAISRITEEDIDAFLDAEVQKKISDSTLSKDIALIRATFALAEKRKIITQYDNFMRFYEKPKSLQKKKPVRALTINEEEKLLRVILENDIPYSDVMLVMLFTGARPGEVLALNVEDIDINGKRLFINKTLTQNIHRQTIVGDKTKTPAGIRAVTLSDSAVEILAKIKGNRTTGRLFSDSNGHIIKVARVRYYLYQTLNRYGILEVNPTEKVTFHSLRHTYATRCFDAEIDSLIVSKQLGHASDKTTKDTYTSVFKEKKIEGMEKLDNYMNSHISIN